MTQNHKYILFLHALFMLPICYLSVTIKQFHFAFGLSLLNHKILFISTFSPTYGTLSRPNSSKPTPLTLYIDRGRGVLLTIIYRFYTPFYQETIFIVSHMSIVLMSSRNDVTPALKDILDPVFSY